MRPPDRTTTPEPSPNRWRPRPSRQLLFGIVVPGRPSRPDLVNCGFVFRKNANAGVVARGFEQRKTKRVLLRQKHAADQSTLIQDLPKTVFILSNLEVVASRNKRQCKNRHATLLILQIPRKAGRIASATAKKRNSETVRVFCLSYAACARAPPRSPIGVSGGLKFRDGLLAVTVRIPYTRTGRSRGRPMLDKARPPPRKRRPGLSGDAQLPCSWRNGRSL
jgi:hypothetical protein